MDLLLRKTKELELQIDEYLDVVVRGALVFREGVKYYLKGETEQFEEHMILIDQMESKADSLRRSIETRLYLETLIPEFRGDVLGLLESSDKVMNRTAETLTQFTIELPFIFEDLKPLFMDLTDAATAAVESMVLAIRAYFRELEKVRDHINKVMFYENETDSIGDKIKRTVFRKDIDLSLKIHMRNFVYHIEEIADEAEDVCDRLAIATIKRHL
jgi:predicted phosphate transport protein (TIGR00153 family)